MRILLLMNINRLDTHGYPQVFVLKNSSVVSSSGIWNGVAFSISPNSKPNAHFTFEFIINQQEIYYRYKLKNESLPSRMVLNPEGAIEHLTWNDRSQSWFSTQQYSLISVVVLLYVVLMQVATSITPLHVTACEVSSRGILNSL